MDNYKVQLDCLAGSPILVHIISLSVLLNLQLFCLKAVAFEFVTFVHV